MGATVGFADIYGPPAGGASVVTGTNPTSGGMGGAGKSIPQIGGHGLPLGLPALIVLGVAAWWLWRVYD